MLSSHLRPTAIRFTSPNKSINESRCLKPVDNSSAVGVRLLKIPFSDLKGCQGTAFHKTTSYGLMPRSTRVPHMIVAVGSVIPLAIKSGELVRLGTSPLKTCSGVTPYFFF